MIQKNNSQTASNTRNSYFDNLKCGLILLVVIGHTSDLLKDSSYTMSAIRTTIYLFHMPLFVFVSGYFANYGVFNINKNILKIINLLGWYIIFKFGLFFEHYFLLGESNAKLSLLVDGGVPWYLFALIVWQLLIPYILVMQRKKVLAVLLFIGLAAGCVDNIGDYMSLSRVLVFGIFFYGGMFFKQIENTFFITMSKWYRVLAGILLLLSFLIIYSFNDFIVKFSRFPTARYSYYASNVDNLQGIILRGIFLLLAIYFGFLFMCTVSPKVHLYTKWGKNTLQVYILHTFIYVYFLNHKELIYEVSGLQQGNLILIISSVLITIFLSGEWISYCFKKISSVFFRAGKILLNYTIVEEGND